jgi:peptidylprolyl isomerase
MEKVLGTVLRMRLPKLLGSCLPAVAVAATLGLAACGSSGGSTSTKQSYSLGSCKLNVSTDLSVAPVYSIPKCASMPEKLTSLVLVQGGGAQIAVGQNVTMRYVAYDWTTGKQVGSSWSDGKPMQVTNIGQDLDVPMGINFTLSGQKLGGRYLLVLPADMTGGNLPGVGADDTVVYIADPEAPVT